MFQQERPCDGSCCRAKPRFPTPDGKSCLYLNENNRCQVMLGEVKLKGKWEKYPKKTKQQAFDETCVNWPHSFPGRKTGDCCWQWIEDG